MTFLDLLKKDGFQVRLVASTSGGEYAGPCPLCGGEDRFRVWPAEGEYGRFWCRGCDWKGDGIEYLRKVRGLSFIQACQDLGKPLPPNRPAGIRNLPKPVWTPKEISLPAGLWRNKAQALVDWCTRKLWSRAGFETLEYLKGRGLGEKTIREARLGFMPRTVFRDRKSWGLPEALNANGRLKRFWIPAGVVIPHFLDGHIARVRVRRPEQGLKDRYIALSGSEMSPMICGQGKSWVVVESELDGLLVAQEAGSLAGVIALGSAQVRPDRLTTELLKPADVILAGLDSDKAGAEAYWRWWAVNFANARRWPVPDGFGKDPGEAFKTGLDLHLWVYAGLPGRSQAGLKRVEQ